MTIHPTFPFRPRFVGEACIYNLLASIPDQKSFAIHSLNLPEHAYKRWGEADFVLVRPSGLVLLEVKGGTVTFADRVWQYWNGRGQSISSTEGPARQALSAACALEKLVEKSIGRKIPCRWGVVFPLCVFHGALVELPPNRRADRQICEDITAFTAWLERLPTDHHDTSELVLLEGERAILADILLPEFSAVSSLGLALNARQEEIHRLTDQQYRILDSLELNPRLLISGGAGTGKTELATLCARAEQQAGRRPVIITRGKALYHALNDKFKSSGINVTTGMIPSGTDTLIVDEGQDFAFPDRLDALFSHLPGGLENGRWRWFQDPNLQFLDEPPEKDSLIRLASNATSVKLRRNVRSTKEIVSCIQTILAADIGIAETDGFGIKVEFRHVSDHVEECALAEKLLLDMIEDGVNPADITFLGPLGAEGPIAHELLIHNTHLLSPMSEGRMPTDTKRGIVTSPAAFRGLESRIVVLIDLDTLPPGIHTSSSLYLAMSRATAALILLVSPVANHRIASLVSSILQGHST